MADTYHGTLNGYTNHKCRCDECKNAIRQYYSEYREKNREKCLEYYREYNAKNRDKTLEYFREYNEKNREKIREQMREHRKRQQELGNDTTGESR